MINIKKKFSQKGFVLFMTVLIISIILVLSLSVAEIILKEMKFSTLAKESFKAFYAADSGVKCAVYWDLVENAFSFTDYDIECANISIPGSMDIDNKTNFSFNLTNGSCVEVFIDKSGGNTVINALGYNISCTASSANKIQRGVRFAY
ncbi:MAG: pilus assembly PilX N-terminal domain-containing protein [Patescibacteria group bacterium]